MLYLLTVALLAVFAPAPSTAARGFARKKPCFCPHVYDPVCVNGWWYSNKCFSKCGKSTRPCPIVEGQAPVDPPLKDCACPDVYDPVCVNGWWYSNKCSSKCGTSKRPCPIMEGQAPIDPPIFDPIPEGRAPDEPIEPIKKPKQPIKKPKQPPTCDIACTDSCTCIKNSEPGCCTSNCRCIKGSKPGCSCKGFDKPKPQPKPHPFPWKV